ncbi:VanZ family protein [Phaeocystidibacter luteus]|uniref:VanZ family protein n=1 Tax=Phaeocystidibacter luteus TaxID=911197 RepID=A0A6N6RL64_9FLAO|nr:VanZ family protein [Phaeocystidibacter luteus]KAB2813762.1 VanZ family protein [Phaeocystidibacter luteus]
MSLLPSQELPNTLVEMNDLVIHGGIYVVFSAALSWAYFKMGVLDFRKTLFVLSSSILFGVFIEFAQASLTTYRHFEFADIGANSVGAILGSLVSFLIYRRLVKTA